MLKTYLKKNTKQMRSHFLIKEKKILIYDVAPDKYLSAEGSRCFTMHLVIGQF